MIFTSENKLQLAHDQYVSAMKKKKIQIRGLKNCVTLEGGGLGFGDNIRFELKKIP